MSGSHSRNKGAGFEREVVNFFRVNKIEAKRYAPMQAGYGVRNSSEPDVKVTYYNRHRDPVNLKVECKRLAAKVIDAAEVLRENPQAHIVAHRKDRDDLMVSMKLHTFLGILKGGMDLELTEGYCEEVNREKDSDSNEGGA